MSYNDYTNNTYYNLYFTSNYPTPHPGYFEQPQAASVQDATESGASHLPMSSFHNLIFLYPFPAPNTDDSLNIHQQHQYTTPTAPPPTPSSSLPQHLPVPSVRSSTPAPHPVSTLAPVIPSGYDVEVPSYVPAEASAPTNASPSSSLATGSNTVIGAAPSATVVTADGRGTFFIYDYNTNAQPGEGAAVGPAAFSGVISFDSEAPSVIGAPAASATARRRVRPKKNTAPGGASTSQPR